MKLNLKEKFNVGDHIKYENKVYKVIKIYPKKYYDMYLCSDGKFKTCLRNFEMERI